MDDQDRIRLLRLQALEEQQKKPPIGYGEDIGRAVVGAPGNLATGIAGLPGDLFNLGSRAATYMAKKTREMIPGEWPTAIQPETQPVQTDIMTSQSVRDFAKQNLPKDFADAALYEPQTLPGKIVQMGTEFGIGGIPAAIKNGVSAIPKLAAVGAGAELAGQGADKAIGPKAGEAVRILLGLAGGHISMAPIGAVKNAARELRIAIDGLTPAQMRQAVEREILAQSMGTPLVGGEALGPAGMRVQRLAGDVMASGRGQNLEAARLARQGQVEQAVTGPGGILETVSPHSDPGIPAGARTAATRPLYEAADLETIPQNAIAPIYNQAIDVEHRTALPAVRSYRDELAAKTGGAADVRVGPYATQYQSWRDRLNLNPAINPRAVDARTRGEINNLNSQLATTLETESPGFRAAQDRYREMSPQVTAAEKRAEMAAQFDKDLNSGGKGQPLQPAAGARFAQSVRGRGSPTSSEKRIEFDKAVRDALVARGLTGRALDSAVDDLNRRMDVLSMQDQIPGMGSPTQPRGERAERMSGNRAASAIEAANVMRGSLLHSVPAWMHGSSLRATQRELDRILADENSTRTLLDLLAMRRPNYYGAGSGGVLGVIGAEQSR